MPKFENVSETRSRTMRAIKGKGTTIEVMMETMLRERLLGFFRANAKGMPGSPDFVFDDHGVVVFCDGDFWHGKNWTPAKCKIKNNRKLWVDKLATNIARDQRNNRDLMRRGWFVLRYWESDIKKRLADIVDEISEALSCAANGLPVETRISRA